MKNSHLAILMGAKTSNGEGKLKVFQQEQQV